MIRKLVYIFNPVSGTANKDVLLKKIEQATRKNDLQFQLLPADITGEYTLLKRKIETENITDVIIIGGDGTVNQVTGSLRDCKVKFGIIPAGSGNGLANTAGISKQADKALEVIFKNVSKKTDAFLINNHYACMLSGLGLDATVAHKFAVQPHRGLTTYVQQTLKYFFKATPYNFEIAVDGFSFFTKAYFISIANCNQFGNYVTIAPKAKLNDGLLDVVIAQDMTKAKLLLTVLHQLRGRNALQLHAETVAQKSILYFQTASLCIKNIDCAPLHIDGEPVETSGEFKIDVIKDCFELLQPE